MSVLFCLPEVSLCQWISIYLLRFSAHMAPWLPQVILSHTPLCCVVVLSRSVVSDCATPWTVAHQAPLSTGILQARIPEWVAMLSSRGSSQPRDQTHISYVSCTGRQVLYHQCHLGSPDRPSPPANPPSPVGKFLPISRAIWKVSLSGSPSLTLIPFLFSVFL